MLHETAEASVSETKLAGLDRSALDEAWGTSLATLSPEAGQYGDEIGKMVNNMLLQTNFLQLAKAAAPLAIPLSKAGATSSGVHAGKKN